MAVVETKPEKKANDAEKGLPTLPWCTLRLPWHAEEAKKAIDGLGCWSARAEPNSLLSLFTRPVVGRG